MPGVTILGLAVFSALVGLTAGLIIYSISALSFKLLRRLTLAVLLMPAVVLEAVVVYNFTMALITNDMKYVFADLAFGIVSIFNVFWLPAICVGYAVGRRERKRSGALKSPLPPAGEG